MDNRNNTDFSSSVNQLFKESVQDPKFSFLKGYQWMITQYYKNVVNKTSFGARGILLAWYMGIGKTLAAISVMMELIYSDDQRFNRYNSPSRPIVVLAMKSLHDNFRANVIKYVRFREATDPTFAMAGLSDEDILNWCERTIRFVTSNSSNMGQILARGGGSAYTDPYMGAAESLEIRLSAMVNDKSTALDGKFLIVDEVHILGRMIVNGSINGKKMYDMVMGAKNLNMLFLSGTPIATESFELVPIFNMLAGREVLPTHYVDWKRSFTTEDGSIKNKWIFQNRISGLVSFIKSDFVPGATHFPRDGGHHIIRVHMTKRQSFLYHMARDKENRENAKMKMRSAPTRTAALTKPKSAGGTSYKVASRQVSICAPETLGLDPVTGKSVNINDMFRFANVKLSDLKTSADLGSNKFKAILDIIQNKHAKQIGYVYCDFTSAGGIAAFARYLEINGYHRYTAGMEHTKSLDSMNDDIPIADDDPVIDTLVSEAVAVKDIFDDHDDSNIQTRKGGGSNSTYAIFSGGESPEDREAIRKVFNSKENIYGDKIQIMLLSSAGAVGVDLMHCRFGMFLGPVWTGEQAEQIKYRGFRNGSHSDMPIEEQEMTIYTFLSVPNDRPIDTVTGQPKPGEKGVLGVLAESTEEEIFRAAGERTLGNATYIIAMAEAACDCTFWGKTSGCRMCTPSGKKLFHDGNSSNPADLFMEDLKASDPCQGIQKKELQVSEIIVGEITYMYSESTKSAYGYDIFLFDQRVNGYRRIHEHDPRFINVITAIGRTNN